MFFIYVLRSLRDGKHYVGFCQDVPQRLGQHNAGISKSTKNRGPWELVYQEESATRALAMRRERFLNSGKGREELKEILKASQSATG